MNRRFFLGTLAGVGGMLLSLASLGAAAEGGNPFVGNWALTIPGGGAGWLGVNENQGKLSASVLWGGGSVLPVDGVKREGDKLVVTRLQQHEQKAASGKSVKVTTTETITASVEGDSLKLTTVKQQPDGKETGKASFLGQRIPPLPPAPDLSKVKFGAPITLFNGKNLDGWKLINPRSVSGWSVKDGVLTNDPVQEAGTPHKSYGNLQTEQEFEDFQLTLETAVPKGGNSGIYLRGSPQVQLWDPENPREVKNGAQMGSGALWNNQKSGNRPLVKADNPAGQWNNLFIRMVGEKVTVYLNGKLVLDNIVMENYWERSKPIYPTGQIELQNHGGPLWFKNVYLRELPR